MSLEKRPVRAEVALSTVHALLAKGELGRVLRTVGVKLVLQDNADGHFRVCIRGEWVPISFAIKYEGKDDQLGALLIGIHPKNMPNNLVPKKAGGWLLFEPFSDEEWAADEIAVDPNFTKSLDQEEWGFYATLALSLRRRK